MYTSRLEKILQSNRGFRGIYISEDFDSLSLTFYEKVILSQVENLSKKKGFTNVTNKYLGLLLNKSSNATSKIVSGLVKAGYLETNLDEKSRRLSLKPKNFWPKEGRQEETGGRLQETEGRQECSHNINKYKKNMATKYVSTFEEVEIKPKKETEKIDNNFICFTEYKAEKEIACQKATEIISSAKLPKPTGSLYKTFGKHYLSLGQQLFEKAVEATEVFATSPNLAYLEKTCSTALEVLKRCNFDWEVASKKIDDVWLKKRYKKDKGLAFEKLDDYFWITKKVKAGPLDEKKVKLVKELCSKHRVRIPQLEKRGLPTLVYYAEVLDEPVFKKNFERLGSRRKSYADLVEQLDLSVSKNLFHKKEFFEYISAKSSEKMIRSTRKKIIDEETRRLVRKRQERIKKLPPIPLFKWSEG